MERVLLSLGSNKSYRMMGDPSHCKTAVTVIKSDSPVIATASEAWREATPQEILAAAVEDMGAYLTDIRCSSVYRTSPMYVTDQDDFFNMAVLAVTELSPHALLRAIHQTEAHFGRDRGREVKNGPRTLDIDIVCFDGSSVNDDDPSIPLEDRLAVPHPRMAERAFVLVPAVELLEADNKWDKSICKMMRLALQKCKGQRVDRVC